MTRAPSTLPDDPARVFATLAAESVCAELLPGAKKHERGPALDAGFALIRAFPDSQPETVWIVMRGHAPGLPEWAGLGWAHKRALGALRDVLVAMDRAAQPEPKPQKPIDFAPMKGIFDKKPGGLLRHILDDEAGT